MRKNDGSTQEYAFPFDVNGFEYEIREVNRCVRRSHTSDILRESDTLTVMEATTALRKSWACKFSGRGVNTKSLNGLTPTELLGQLA